MAKIEINITIKGTSKGCFIISGLYGQWFSVREYKHMTKREALKQFKAHCKSVLEEDYKRHH